MKIYFAGSIRGGRNDKEKYRQIIEWLKEYGTVLTEHIGLDTLSSEGQVEFTSEQIFIQDMKWVEESDIVIAEVTQPSLGVGYEIGQAQAMGKRVVCLYNKNGDRRLSAMIVGNEYIENYSYSELSELEPLIKELFTSN